MVKIAYLLSNRPEFPERLRKLTGREPLIVGTGENGTYREQDLAKLADMEALIVLNEPVTEQLLAACPRVKIVQRLGVGYDKVDLESAARRGIPCCNVAGVNKESVAEHCLALILGLTRNLFEMDKLTKAVDWGGARLANRLAFELKGKTLGIIGLGDIGASLGRRARGFEMSIVYNDIRPIDDRIVEELGARFLEKEALYESSDIISINVDLNPTSAGIIDRTAISSMKEGAYLICCARGGIVDEHALRDALNSGHLAGAGIDVFAEEPFPTDNPLLSAKNIILTPHIAGVTQEATERTFRLAHENVTRVIKDGEKPRWVVNGV